MTDPSGEAREARGQRSGIVYPLPLAARPDTRLMIDAALPEAAALYRTERPPTVLDIPEPKTAGGNSLFRTLSTAWIGARPAANPANGPGIAPLESSGSRSALHTVAIGVSSSLLPV